MPDLSLRWDSVQGLWLMTAAVLLAMFAFTLLVYSLDERNIDGVSVWAKPLKFEISLCLHFVTLGLIVGALSSSWQHSSMLRVVAVASVIATVFEIAYIVFQAAHQQQSHFNVGTAFHATMYTLMAIGAVIIVGAAAVVGIVAVVDHASQLTSVLRHGIALGLFGGTILTLIVAFTMGSALTRHVGLEPSGAPTMPFTGWSLSAGDLRVPHFFATHMIQAIPLVALAAQALLPSAIALGAVWLAAAGWTALVLVTYRQALAAEPLMSHGWIRMFG